MATKTKSGGQLDREIDEVLQARQKRVAKAAPAAVAQRWAGQDDYESRELRTAQGRLAEIARAPLADRKEAQAEFLAAMKTDPELVAERMSWLLNGSFGRGEQMMAERIVAAPRMNRAAALTQLTGAFEWQCPADMGAAAWKKLSAGEKLALDRAVQKVIKSAGEA